MVSTRDSYNFLAVQLGRLANEIVPMNANSEKRIVSEISHLGNVLLGLEQTVEAFAKKQNLLEVGPSRNATVAMLIKPFLRIFLRYVLDFAGDTLNSLGLLPCVDFAFKDGEEQTPQNLCMVVSMPWLNLLPLCLFQYLVPTIRMNKSWHAELSQFLRGKDKERMGLNGEEHKGLNEFSSLFPMPAIPSLKGYQKYIGLKNKVLLIPFQRMLPLLKQELGLESLFRRVPIGPFASERDANDGATDMPSIQGWEASQLNLVDGSAYTPRSNRWNQAAGSDKRQDLAFRMARHMMQTQVFDHKDSTLEYDGHIGLRWNNVEPPLALEAAESDSESESDEEEKNGKREVQSDDEPIKTIGKKKRKAAARAKKQIKKPKTKATPIKKTRSKTKRTSGSSESPRRRQKRVREEEPESEEEALLSSALRTSEDDEPPVRPTKSRKTTGGQAGGHPSMGGKKPRTAQSNVNTGPAAMDLDIPSQVSVPESQPEPRPIMGGKRPRAVPETQPESHPPIMGVSETQPEVHQPETQQAAASFLQLNVPCHASYSANFSPNLFSLENCRGAHVPIQEVMNGIDVDTFLSDFT